MQKTEWINSMINNHDKEYMYQLSTFNTFQQQTGSEMSFLSYKKYVHKLMSDKGLGQKEKPGPFAPFPKTFSKAPLNEDEVKVEEVSEGDIYKAVLESTWIKTPEQFIEYLKVDISKWELVKFVRNTWGSKANPNIQVKGEFKPRNTSIIDYKQIAKEAIQEYKPKFNFKLLFKKAQSQAKSDNMLEIAIVDHHFGQLSLPEETMQSPYNLDVAYNTMKQGVADILLKAEPYNVDKILLVLGNDFFNSDSALNSTTGGTPQAEATRWQETFKRGLHACIDTIEYCSTKALDVEVVMIPGNHDFERSYYLGCILEQRYFDSNHVRINNGAAPRKYISWGKCLLCFTHGSDETKNSLPLVVSREAQKEWAYAKYVEIHKGHFHKEQEKMIITDEESSIKERILPSLVSRDDWHTKKGYLSLRESMAFIWNKEKGNEAIFKYHP